MPKLFVVDLDQWSIDKLLTPIRRKNDLILYILNAIRLVGTAGVSTSTDISGHLVISVAKMSRVTCVTQEKIVSVNLPFQVEEVDNVIQFYSKSIGFISSVELSHATRLFLHGDFDNNSCISEFADEIMDITELKPGFWGFIKELLLMEDGYVRYDYDSTRVNGRNHPLNHIDICYSSGATFKFGLDMKVEYSEFLDILDIQTECYYLAK